MKLTAKARSNKWATFNTDPTMTDQSGADDTDINLIVKKYGVFGTVPGSANPPQYGDYADLPTDLRGQIELIRSIPELQQRLPEKIRTMDVSELLNLTPEQLNNILKPAEPPPPVPNKDEPK